MKRSNKSRSTTYYILIQGILLIIIVFQASMESASGQWLKHQIDGSLSHTNDIKANDFDSDGDMDLFVAEEYGGNLLMYECSKQNGLQWTKHVIDSKASGCLGVDVADFDGDSVMDILATHFTGDQVVWYKRGYRGNPYEWEKHTIDNTYDGPALVWARDFNGDGSKDVVVKYNNSGGLIWYENNLPSGWIRHPIAPTFTGRGDIFVADFNNDNRPDVVGAQRKHGKVILYLNDLLESGWKEVFIDMDRPGAQGCSFGDIDNDGDMDVVSTGKNPNLLWYENQDSGQTWIKHNLDVGLSGIDVSIIRDLDNDGYVDIIPTDYDGEGLFWLRNEDGGQNWANRIVDSQYHRPLAGFAYDIDLDQDIDLVPSRWAVGTLVWYENPLPSAYASSLTASPFLIHSQSDTLRINATLYNPEEHPAMAWAVISGDQTGFTDNLQLFDDGLHGDGDPMDNQWGSKRLVSDFPEDEFLVELFTYDSTYGDTLGFGTPARFFTLGPVEYDKHIFYPLSPSGDSIPNPNEWINLKIALKNSSEMATATNIKAKLTSLDSLVNIIESTLDFIDMPAGHSALTNTASMVWIDQECPDEKEIPIKVSVYSHGYLCWQDTFAFVVHIPVKIEKYNEPQIRIYPNPVIDLISIETGQSDRFWVKINSLNGQLLFSDRNLGPIYQIDLSSFQKGIYFITIRAKDFIATRKIVKLQ